MQHQRQFPAGPAGVEVTAAVWWPALILAFQLCAPFLAIFFTDRLQTIETVESIACLLSLCVMRQWFRSMTRRCPGISELGLLIWRWALSVLLLLVVTFVPADPLHRNGVPADYLDLIARVVHLLQLVMVLAMIRLQASIRHAYGRTLQPLGFGLSLHAMLTFLFGTLGNQVTPAGELVYAAAGLAPIAGALLSLRVYSVQRGMRPEVSDIVGRLRQWDREIQARLQL